MGALKRSSVNSAIIFIQNQLKQANQLHMLVAIKNLLLLLWRPLSATGAQAYFTQTEGAAVSTKQLNSLWRHIPSLFKNSV